MKGLQIIVWVGLAIFIYFTWPWEYTHFEFTQKHHEFDDYSVEIYANGKLNYHRDKKGVIKISARVHSDKIVLDKVILKSRKFTPPIDLEFCSRNRAKRPYCAGDIDQPFYENAMIKGYTSYWSIDHVLGNHDTAMQNTSYQYEIQICPESSACFLQSVAGELTGSANNYIQTPMARVKNNAWVKPVYYVVALFLLISAFLFSKNAAKGGKEKQWLLPLVIAAILAPLGGFLLGLLSYMNVNSFEGANAYAMVYVMMITTPLLFVIVLFIAKKLFSK